MNQAIGWFAALDVLITGLSASIGYSRTCCRRALTVVIAASRFGADGELQRDLAARVHALARHLGHAFDAFELLLLLLDDLLFDFLRAGAGPGGLDRERGDLHVRDELDRHPADGDQAEHHQQDHEDRDLDGVLDEVLDETHAEGSGFKGGQLSAFSYGLGIEIADRQAER